MFKKKYVMITINTWKNNYIIAHDPHSKIEIDSLNKLFVSLVDKIGDSDQDSIERAKRKGEYLLIAGHAATTLVFWEEIFYSPLIIWSDPLFIKLQIAVTNIEVLGLGIILSLFFIIFGINTKKILKNNMI